MTRAVLLDLEGTTTPVEFVHETLFPYARERVEEWLADHGGEVDEALAALRAEHESAAAAGEAIPAWDREEDPSAAAPYLRWLMDRDRKSTGLKEIQGRVWVSGYESGELVGPVFDDVPEALAMLRERGVRIAIFSSGSVLAQQLLLGHSSAGDLRHLVDAWFDTTTGSKREPASYRRIAGELGVAPAEITFVSDANDELGAAAAAGMRVVLSLRGVDPATEGRPAVASLVDPAVVG